MKKLAIYLSNFNGGGAERMHLSLAPEFAKRGFEVVFVVQQLTGSLVKDIPKDIRVVTLGTRRTILALWPLIRFLEKEQPDILISNLGHNNIIAVWAKLFAKCKTRLIATQHNILSIESTFKATLGYRVLPFLYRHFLKYADAIVGVSKGATEDLRKFCGFRSEMLYPIYNPIVGPDFDERMNAPVTHKWLQHKDLPVFISVGRFCLQKDFPTLIRAFALLLKKRPALLLLIGEGDQKEALEQLAQELGVRDHIDMPGFQLNPLPFIKHSDVLVMSSLYEGFGNVLVEALACSTAVVSTDCISGPGEILDNGKYGSLVPVGDSQAMADAMSKALDMPADKSALRERGLEFSVANSATQYIDLINRLTGA